MYFPKFADMEVAELDAKGETITGKVPAARQITLRDLMMHTSGLDLWRARQHRRAQALSGRQRCGGRDLTGAEFMDKLRRCRC